MPRMFDVLKGKIKESQDKKAVVKEGAESDIRFPREIRTVFNPQANRNNNLESPKELVEALKNKYVDDIEAVKEKYTDALKFIEALLNKVNKEEYEGLSAEGILVVVDNLTNQLFLGNNLLELVAREYPAEDYLPAHLVNVCILALVVGMQLNLNKSKLHILGGAALLHDLSLAGLKDILKVPGLLSQEEFQAVRFHPYKSAEIISKFGPSYEAIKEIVQQHHERVDGQGYPSGFRGNEINEFAKIIAIVDTYEAMTHHRPYRDAKMPHHVIKEIVFSLKKSFDSGMLKALFNKISIYPIGSFVKLNNGDVGKVIAVNANSVLRPVVLIILDCNGQYIPEPVKLDLSRTEAAYIKEPFILTEKE